MKIEIRKSAVRDLRQLSSQVRECIHAAIKKLEKFPDVANCKKLTNFEPAYRLRIGNYRIPFDVLDDAVIIARILHRKKSYRG